jgi:hypothetical protein
MTLAVASSLTATVDRGAVEAAAVGGDRARCRWAARSTLKPPPRSTATRLGHRAAGDRDLDAGGQRRAARVDDDALDGARAAATTVAGVASSAHSANNERCGKRVMGHLPAPR